MDSNDQRDDVEATRTSEARRFAKSFTLAMHAALAALTLTQPAGAAVLAGAILVALLAGASYTDLRWRRIPNWLTYPSLAWTLVLAAFASPLTPASVLPGTAAATGLWVSDALLGAAVSFAAMLLLYRLSGAGGGDVKLAAAIGALVGVQAGLSTILWCHLLAAAGMLVYLAGTADWRRLANTVALRLAVPLPFSNADRRPTLSASQPTQVPLAAYFAGGVVLTLSGASLV